MENCELCSSAGGQMLWADEVCRIVLVEGEEAELYPGFCRVIWNTHVAEMSDLSEAHRNHLLRVLTATEVAVRELVRPDKINLAALGNMVPHLHWHVIPRWRDDSRFPKPIWAPAERPRDAGTARPAPESRALAARLEAALKSK